MSGHSATARRARARGPSSTALLLLCTLARAQDFDDDFGDDSQGYLYPSPPPPPSVGSVGSSSSCIFTAPLGERFDLTPMARTDHDYTGATTGGYTYRFNVCGNTNRLCNAQPAPAAKWRGTKCNNLGDSSTQTVSLLDGRDPSKGLKLTYTNGDICKRQIDGQMEIGSRLVSYEVYCNAGEEGKLRHINEVSMCEYVILFDSRHACPSGGPNGGPLHGRGWRLIFFMLFCALTYLGVGIYLNGRNEGKHGVEAIPHIRYWEEVPGLVRDGLQFSYVHGKAYSEIALEKGKVVYEAMRSKYTSLNNQTPS